MSFQPEKITSFQNYLKQDTFNRYKSWKHCYEAFADIKKDNDYLGIASRVLFSELGDV